MRGASIGIVGALICAAAVWQASFWLLCFGALVFGTYNAFGQYYRFVAAEVAPPDFRATAVSLVLAGGLVGGILGPTSSRFTVDLVGPKFTGAYLALIVFVLVTMAILSPHPHSGPERRRAGGERPAAVARSRAQPKYIVAVLSGAISYGVMNFLMTSTPIAMRGLRPSLRRRRLRDLLARGGDVRAVLRDRAADQAPRRDPGDAGRRGAQHRCASAIALSGVAVANFWWSLVLLGVGWNFLYIGATTLLTETYRPEERAKAQGANETAIFAMMAMSSFTSGMIVTNAGWEKVNYAATPLIAIVIAGAGVSVLQDMKKARA